MADNTQASQGGVGLFGLMFLLFLGLKLGGVIDWSWWWVTAPLWGPFVVVAVGIVLFVGVSMVVHFFRARASKRRYQKRWGPGN